jgi:periplasmic protein CpxP/Spy
MNTSTFQTQSRQRFPLRLLLATCTLALAAGVAQTSSAAPGAGPGYNGGPGPGMMAGGMGGGYGMGGMGGMYGGRQIDRMLDIVSATPEQRARIKPIVDAARTELQASFEAGRKLHEQNRALFAQPNVDAGAVEALRQQMLAQHDQVSRRMTQVMLEVSGVLTPEQRKTLADRMAQRRGMMERHRAERATL